jgi:hypothetical protein
MNVANDDESINRSGQHNPERDYSLRVKISGSQI